MVPEFSMGYSAKYKYFNSFRMSANRRQVIFDTHSIVFRAASDTSKWLSLLFVWGLGFYFCHFSLISEMRQFSTNLQP